MFHHRQQAAEALARRLTHLQEFHPLVLAIPRGGVPMGRCIADALGGELDVVLVRKLGAPGNPEFAIGAVDDTGQAWLEESATLFDEQAVADEIACQRALLEERRRRYGAVRATHDPAGRYLVVVDDGSATGATMASALTCLRRHEPRRLIAALGVASATALSRLEGLADEVLCIETPHDFVAVGQFYADFRPVEDDEVIRLLADDNAQR